MKITILYFDDAEPSQINDSVAAIKSVVDNDVIALPKNFDVMLDCSLDQLVNVRAIIDTAIQVKISQEHPESTYDSGSNLPPS